MTQYLQNAFTVAGLLFSLLLVDSVAFMLGRQQRMFEAVFTEISEVQALIEQLDLLCSGRGTSWVGDEFARSLLDELEAYLAEDFGRLGEPRLLGAPGDVADRLESIVFATSVGLPSVICDTVMALRRARAKRLAAAQFRLPRGHFIVLGLFAAFVLGIFVLLCAGTAGFEPAANMALPGGIVSMQQVLFGFLCGAIALAALVLYELRDPSGGLNDDSGAPLFGVKAVAMEAIRGITAELHDRRQRRDSRAIEA